MNAWQRGVAHLVIKAWKNGIASGCAFRIALGLVTASLRRMTKSPALSPEYVSDIVQMALSDHVSFHDIRREYGMAEKDVKALMRQTLKTGSYRAWRKRVRDFGDRRENYK